MGRLIDRSERSRVANSPELADFTANQREKKKVMASQTYTTHSLTIHHNNSSRTSLEALLGNHILRPAAKQYTTHADRYYNYADTHQLRAKTPSPSLPTEQPSRVYKRCARRPITPCPTATKFPTRKTWYPSPLTPPPSPLRSTRPTAPMAPPPMDMPTVPMGMCSPRLPRRTRTPTVALPTF